MNDDIDLIELIEKDIIAFDAVSRFPGLSLSENIQKAIGMDIADNWLHYLYWTGDFADFENEAKRI